jgi:hypothetical protein
MSIRTLIRQNFIAHRNENSFGAKKIVDLKWITITDINNTFGPKSSGYLL